MTEKKSSHEARLASRTGEQVFLLLFQNHPLPMWICDLETLAFLDVNDAAVTRYGYSRAEFMEMTIEDIHASEDVPRLLADTAERRSALLHSREWRYRLRDGRVTDVEITSHTLEFDGRKAVLTIAQDITERKLAELERRRAEEQTLIANERLQYLLSSTSAVIYTAKSSGDYGATFISGNVSPMVGYDPREFTEDSRFWFNHVHPDDQVLISDAVSETFEKEFHAYEYRFRCRDGEYIWVRDEMKVVRDGDRNPLEIIGFWVDITERKEAEEELGKARQDWEDIFQAIGHPAMLLSPNQMIIVANRAALRATRMKPTELIGRKCYEIFHPMNGDRPPESCPMTNMLQSGQVQTEEMEVEALGGYFLVSCTPVLDNEGNLTKIIHIATDVTERKRAEEALREGEERYRALFLNSLDAILVSTPGGSILAANPVACDVLGRTEEELRQRGWRGIVVDPTDPRLRAALQERARTGKFSGELSLVRKDGTEFPVEVSTAGFRDSKGEECTSSIIRDITERKKAEEALHQSEQRWKDLFRRSRNAIAVYTVIDDGRDFIFKDFNPAAEHVEGVKREDIVGRRATEVFPGVESFGLLDVFRRVWKTGNPEHHDVSLYKDEKIEGWRENFVYRLQSGEIVAIYDDVTERKRLTHRLIEVQETERRAIARELHDEIGQELTALKIGLQDAASSFPENKLRPHVEDSLKSVERTLERVRNLSLELRPSMLDDLGLLPTLRWLLDRTAQRSGVKCTMQAEIRGEKIAPEIAVTCYRVVQQALTNVGRHAKAKSVEVSIRREDHRLSVQIADDGIGFDVRGARKRALLGESLGLLSMEERVGLLGGKFEIRSSKGKGTVVRAEFPM